MELWAAYTFTDPAAFYAFFFALFYLVNLFRYWSLIRIHFISSYLILFKGFRAEGNHIPTPPPIPQQIAKALQYIRSVQPQQIGFNQNQYNQQQQQQQ